MPTSTPNRVEPVLRMRRLPPPDGIEITLKPDHVTYGDFPPPTPCLAPLPEERIMPDYRSTPRRPGLRAESGPTSEPLPPKAPPPRRWRPPRLPEPVYARLRRMAVEVVCFGFVGIAVLTICYHLARTALR